MERRICQRQRMIFRPAYLSTGSGLFYVVMRNVSSDGASFSGLAGLQQGEGVTYFVGTSGPVDAIVRWASGGSFGVQNAVRLEDLAGCDPEFPYRSVRIPLVTEVRLYRRGSGTPATLYNFSQGRACVASSAQLAVGELVTLKLAGLVVEAAEIKWISGRRAGVKFARSLGWQTMQVALGQLQFRPAYGKESPGDCGIPAAGPAIEAVKVLRRVGSAE